jgi:hypothetical protein
LDPIEDKQIYDSIHESLKQDDNESKEQKSYDFNSKDPYLLMQNSRQLESVLVEENK